MDAANNKEPGNSAEQLLGRIAQVTRQLRDGVRELGLDKQLERAAQEIPSTRERLNYIAETTERAADRTLNAIDAAQPLQDALVSEAKGLDGRWTEWFANPIEMNQARELVLDTRAYLGGVPERGNAVNAQLMEIMMAQEFQDLTGQVIKKMLDVFNEVEAQLLQVLIDNSPPDKRAEAEAAVPNLLNGPQTSADATDALTGQSQVDDLLESLGF